MDDDEAAQDAAQEPQRKEMKVKIPAQHHRTLHKLKIITDKQISTAVTEALARYLEEHDLPEAPEDEATP